jgi:hypothetical protein
MSAWSVPNVVDTGQPIGKLASMGAWLVSPDQVQQLRSRYSDEKWASLPAAVREAKELAALQCVDEAGQHWTCIGDAKVLRAAFPEQGEIRPGEHREVYRHWWIDQIPIEAFPLMSSGWIEDVG